jgi:hypothetical protein
MIDRYQKIHRTGMDCRVTCTRNLLDFYGHRYSYSDIQGLSSAFFFTYRSSYTAKDVLLHPEIAVCDYLWPVSGHRVELLENLSYVFNATLATGHPLTPEHAQAEILPFLAEGIPVMTMVSREVLRRHYSGERYAYPDFMGGQDFAGHWIVVLDIDRKRNVATVFETHLNQRLEVPLDVLSQARTVGDDQPHFHMKSKNRWAVFLPPASLPPLEHMMLTALRRVVFNHRDAAAANDPHMGLPGLQNFCDELPGWGARDDLGPHKLRATLFMMRMTSDMLAGTGLGRRNFGVFLRHAQSVTKNAHLGEAASCYGDLVGRWSTLMGCVEGALEASPASPSFDTPAIRSVLAEILDGERQGMHLLERAVC